MNYLEELEQTILKLNDFIYPFTGHTFTIKLRNHLLREREFVLKTGKTIKSLAFLKAKEIVGSGEN